VADVEQSGTARDTVDRHPPGRFTITKSYELDGVSHELALLPEGHKCRRNHGHNYVITVTVTAARLDAFGFVTDFGDLRPCRQHLESLDHRRLNDVVDFHPTSELLAHHLGTWFAPPRNLVHRPCRAGDPRPSGVGPGRGDPNLHGDVGAG
jgi:6-pyruvoyltetrahydropterin/6-carboxytetrahydropterin synthase